MCVVGLARVGSSQSGFEESQHRKRNSDDRRAASKIEVKARRWWVRVEPSRAGVEEDAARHTMQSS